MGFEEIWNEYTSSEKDMFQKSVRRLLKQTFIVRDRDEDSKKAYYFVSKRTILSPSVRNHFQRTWDISDTIL